MANLGIFEQLSEARKFLIIIETLQQVDSDTMEATSASQEHFLYFIIHLGVRDNMEERDIDILSTYTQRLKQLGFSLDTLEDAEPAIVRWMRLLLTGNNRPTLGSIRSTLQIVLSLGADINARAIGYPSLIYLIINYRHIDTDDKESNTRFMTEIIIALLESGSDLLTLSYNGFSVFDVAEYCGRTSELALALQETGYDFDEVKYKIALAQWNFFNPGHSLAESTAVDRSQSTAGMVSRRAIAGDRLEE